MGVIVYPFTQLDKLYPLLSNDWFTYLFQMFPLFNLTKYVKKYFISTITLLEDCSFLNLASTINLSKDVNKFVLLCSSGGVMSVKQFLLLWQHKFSNFLIIYYKHFPFKSSWKSKFKRCASTSGQSQLCNPALGGLSLCDNSHHIVL